MCRTVPVTVALETIYMKEYLSAYQTYNLSEDILLNAPSTHLGVIFDIFSVIPYPVNQITKLSTSLVIFFTPVCHYLSPSHYSLIDCCFLQTVFFASDFCMTVICLKYKSNLIMLLLKIFQCHPLSSQKLISANGIQGLYDQTSSDTSLGIPEKALSSSPNNFSRVFLLTFAFVASPVWKVLPRLPY